MAKNNATTKDLQTVKDGLNEIMLTGDTSTGVTLSDAFDILENTDVSKMRNQSREYLSFDKVAPGTRFDFLFEGAGTADLDGKTVDIVYLRNKLNQQFICASAVLVGAMKKVDQIPSLVSVVYNGTAKSAKGSYADLTVYTL